MNSIFLFLLKHILTSAESRDIELDSFDKNPQLLILVAGYLFKTCFFILRLVYGWKQPETRLNHEP
jgi:hypothetical protein